MGIKLHRIPVSHFTPGTLPHIREVLRWKHPGQDVKVLYRAGGEVVYTVGDKTKEK